MFGIDGSASERARAYEFLAGIFLKEPVTEVVKILKDWVQTAQGNQTDESEDEEQEDNLSEIFNRFETKDPELKGLTQEFYDLFFVPVSGRFVPPFESPIRGAERQEGKKIKYGSHWGLQTHRIFEYYERLGFQPEALNIFEPLKQTKIPDHLGFELSFLAYLCRLEEVALQSGQETAGLRQLQQRILQDHLLGWLPQFIEDLERVESTGYYPYFAQLALEWCQEQERSGSRG